MILSHFMKENNMEQKIDKHKFYKHVEGGKIWDGEDFSDGSVLLYEMETGDDITIEICNFMNI